MPLAAVYLACVGVPLLCILILLVDNHFEGRD